MKKLNILILILIPLVVFSKSQSRHDGEFIVELTNYGTSWNVTFTATAIDARWDENYHLTSDYSSASTTIPTPEYPAQITAYFDLIVDPNAGENPIMAIGLYKISAFEYGVKKAHFYMDWRTSDYGSCPDVYFKYDVLNNRFRNAGDTQTINGTTQTIWDLNGSIDLVTSGLELYTHLSSQNGHPHLSWSEYHISVSGYYVHKKLTTTSGTRLTEHYTTSTSWTDNDFTIGHPKFSDDHVEYWITAKLSESQQSLDGNNVKATGTSYIQWKKLGDRREENVTSYELYQNYPNPFNPTTTIKYQLKNSSYVKLTVYDALGKEVVQLVNTNQEAGSYNVIFNAANLPSGIYIYKLVYGNNSKVRKMLLLK